MNRTDVVEHAQAIRNSIDKVTENLTDADAVAVADLFLPLAAGVDYAVGDRRRFSDALYYLPHELIGQYFEEVT